MLTCLKSMNIQVLESFLFTVYKSIELRTTKNGPTG